MHGGLCQRRVKATNALDTSRSVTPAILGAAGAVGVSGGSSVRHIRLGRDRVLPLASQTGSRLRTAQDFSSTFPVGSLRCLEFA
jgi:hypothetical protein